MGQNIVDIDKDGNLDLIYHSCLRCIQTFLGDGNGDPDLVCSMLGEGRHYGSGMYGKGHKEYMKNSSGSPYIKTVIRLGLN